MSNIFDEENDGANRSQGVEQSSDMSLDSRGEQLENKVNQELNASLAADTQAQSGQAQTGKQGVSPKSEASAQSTPPQGSGAAQSFNSPYVTYTYDNQATSGSVPTSFNNARQSGDASPTGQSPYSQQSGGYSYTDYTGGGPYSAAAPKKPMSRELKAFLTVVVALSLIFVAGLTVEGVRCYNETGGFEGLGGFDSWLEEYDYDEFAGGEDSDESGGSDDGSYSDSDSAGSSDSAPAEADIKSAPDSETVVNADAEKIVAADQPEDIDSAEYNARKAYKRVEPSVVGVVTYDGDVGVYDDADGEGSGIVITSDGYIVTNSHVISDTKDIGVEVITSDGTSYIAAIVGFDSRTDLAVLKIDAEGLTPVEFVNSDQIEVGQDALAVGNPGGLEYSNSLTKGAVSAMNRTVDSNSMVYYIQTDAAINPGNSGGPLLNIAGQVMGINTVKIVDEQYEGMGFAIPSNTVIEIVNDLMTQGYVSGRVRIGIMGQVVSSYVASIYGIEEGIMITGFADNSPFDGTEAKLDDIITAVNGEEISNFTDLYGELEKYSPGDKVTVTLYRSDGNKTFDVEITLVEDKGETQSSSSYSGR